MSDTSTKLRMSVSRKNKQTGEYEQDFSGFVLAVGTMAARKALSLEKGARIKIGDCDVTTKYDPQKKVTYTNYKLFSFTDAKENGTSVIDRTDPQPVVDEGEIEENELPY